VRLAAGHGVRRMKGTDLLQVTAGARPLRPSLHCRCIRDVCIQQICSCCSKSGSHFGDQASPRYEQRCAGCM
jgi:hypothetical protein